jgi:hypothetical protein
MSETKKRIEEDGYHVFWDEAKNDTPGVGSENLE